MGPAGYREQIYDLFAEPDEGLATKIDRALEIGTEYLDLPIGFLTQISDGTQRIVRASGDHPLIQPGETCPLENAYCRRTIEMDETLAVQDTTASTEISEQAVETFALGTYIGAKIVTGGETYGTICFASEAERESSFSEAERFFVELIAGLVGQAYEREEYEQQLAEREAELQERQAINRALIDASFDLVFRIDTGGEFTYISDSIEELLGYEAGAYVDEPFTEIIPEDRETLELAQMLYEQSLAGETVEELSFPLEHADGDRVFVDIRATPIYEDGEERGESEHDTEETAVSGENAEIVGIQGTVRDATERHRRERLIRVLNRVLRHNLRNDMNVVGGFSKELRRRLTGEEADIAGRIADTSDRLVVLSETARRLEENLEVSVTVRPLDLVPIVERAASQIAERYPNAVIDVEIPESVTVRAAPRIETAVWELVDNAARHAGEEPTVEIRIEQDEQRVSLLIEDDGPGLPEQERTVLADGEESSLVHGSGLGLWLVHWTVESIDGCLDVRDCDCETHVRDPNDEASADECDCGACIEITLERADAR